MRFVTILIAAAALRAGVTWSTSAGASGTCSSNCTSGLPTAPQHAAGATTYTVTCTSGTGSTTELQNAMNDMYGGDTIQLTFGCAWTADSGSSIRIMRPKGGTGVRTYTTTEYAKLPSSGTRLTPAYAPILPTIYGDSAIWALTIASGAVPADGIVIRGIRFAPSPLIAQSAAVSYALLYIGSNEAPGWAGNYPWWDVLTTSAPVAGNNFVDVADTTGFVDGGVVQVGCYTQLGAYQASMTIASHTATRLTFTSTLPTLASCNPYPANSIVNQRINSTSQFPNNITIQHCYFTNPGARVAINKMIDLNARNATIRDNFFENEYDYSGSDGQVITTINGVGPWTIENNYIHGSGENIEFYGGGIPVLDNVVDGVTLRYNFLPHIPEMERHGPWAWTQDPGSPGAIDSSSYRAVNHIINSPRYVFAGRHVFKSADLATVRASGIFTTVWFRAKNSGFVGTTEPNLASATACNMEVTDNQVTWVRVSGCPGLSTWVPPVKNNFELKSGRNITLQYNVLDWHDGGEQYAWNGSQDKMINIKVGAYPPFSAACYNTNTTLHPTCFHGRTTGISIKNNWLRNADGGFVFMGGQGGKAAESGNYTLEHNLITQTEKPVLYDGTLYNWLSISPGYTATGNNYDSMSGVRVRNNTFYRGFNYDSRLFFIDATSSADLPNGEYAYNVTSAGTGANSGTFNAAYWPTIANWQKNVAVGGSTSGFNAGSTINYCLNSSSCNEDTAWTRTDATYGKLLQNIALGDFRVAESNGFAKRTNPYGNDLGADLGQIPAITDIRWDRSDTRLIVHYTVSAPLEGIGGSLELHEAPDFADTASAHYVGELASISTNYGKDSSEHPRNPKYANERTIRIEGLTANTTYYYRLHHGDTRRGIITTGPTPSGTGGKYAPNCSTSLVYSTTGYDRTTDTLTSPTTVSCTGGKATVTGLTVGAVLYYRRDSDPVRVTIVR